MTEGSYAQNCKTISNKGLHPFLDNKPLSVARFYNIIICDELRE